VLSMVSFSVGMASSVLLADLGYGVMPNVILESVRVPDPISSEQRKWLRVY
jgi:hypothetical protein